MGEWLPVRRTSLRPLGRPDQKGEGSCMTDRSRQLTRRNLVRGFGATAGMLALASCAPPAPTAAPTTAPAAAPTAAPPAPTTAPAKPTTAPAAAPTTAPAPAPTTAPAAKPTTASAAAPAIPDFSEAKIDWQQAKGTDIKLISVRFPIADALNKMMPDFQKLTGFSASIEQLPEDQFF